MHFCPTCANILQECNGPEGFRFFCNSCPYVHAIKKPIAQRTYLKRKEVDDVLGGADAWKNVDQTEGASRGVDGMEREGRRQQWADATTPHLRRIFAKLVREAAVAHSV